MISSLIVCLVNLPNYRSACYAVVSGFALMHLGTVLNFILIILRKLSFVLKRHSKLIFFMVFLMFYTPVVQGANTTTEEPES